MIDRLLQILRKREKLVIGLMSGTSADGVDTVLVRIRGSSLDTELELIDFRTYPYPKGLREMISNPSSLQGKGICQLNFLLGELFAEAVIKLLQRVDIEPSMIDLIGSHGQTVCHLPGEENLLGYRIRSTLQIGEPSVIAKRTGIVTVADFRPADIAFGGGGAPLIPYFDYLVFRSSEKSRGVLNIGGIANLTVLRKGCLVDKILAFDTGPGNMVIDGLMRRLFERDLDKGGEEALKGKVSEKLLGICLDHPYFRKSPPKSTGREEFGEEFIENFMKEADGLGLNKQDIIATATELTARSIYQSYCDFVLPEGELDELIVSGGGVHNRCLMTSLGGHFSGVKLKTSDDFGIPSDAKEAVCLAVLANEAIHGNPSNIPTATGAYKQTVLGKICI